jgi:hypothetical protein
LPTSASEKRATFVLQGRPLGACSLLLVAVVAAVVSGLVAPGLWAWVAVAASIASVVGGASVVRYLRSPRVEVGRDGVLVRDLRARRFIAYEAVESVHYLRPEKVGEWFVVELRLHGGDVIALRSAERVGEEWPDDPKGMALFRAIRAAHAEFDAAPRSLPRELTRGARSGMEWLRDLRALGRHGYRRPGLDEAALAGAIAQPGAPAARKAAASIVLYTMRPDTREMLRVAADEIVEPNQRALLLRVADPEDDEELAAALEALEPAPNKHLTA